jgi:hypothetical protein
MTRLRLYCDVTVRNHFRSRPWRRGLCTVPFQSYFCESNEVSQCRSNKKYTTRVFGDTLQLEESRSPGVCVSFSLICSLSQELADLPIVAIDNLPEAIVGWRWYSRRHKAEAYTYSVTQKRSSSPWTTGTAQFKFKVTYVVMFHHLWIPLLSSLLPFQICQPYCLFSRLE